MKYKNKNKIEKWKKKKTEWKNKESEKESRNQELKSNNVISNKYRIGTKTKTRKVNALNEEKLYGRNESNY